MKFSSTNTEHLSRQALMRSWPKHCNTTWWSFWKIMSHAAIGKHRCSHTQHWFATLDAPFNEKATGHEMPLFLASQHPQVEAQAEHSWGHIPDGRLETQWLPVWSPWTWCHPLHVYCHMWWSHFSRYTKPSSIPFVISDAMTPVAEEEVELLKVGKTSSVKTYPPWN